MVWSPSWVNAGEHTKGAKRRSGVHFSNPAEEIETVTICAVAVILKPRAISEN